MKKLFILFFIICSVCSCMVVTAFATAPPVVTDDMLLQEGYDLQEWVMFKRSDNGKDVYIVAALYKLPNFNLRTPYFNYYEDPNDGVSYIQASNFFSAKMKHLWYWFVDGEVYVTDASENKLSSDYFVCSGQDIPYYNSSELWYVKSNEVDDSLVSMIPVDSLPNVYSETISIIGVVFAVVVVLFGLRKSVAWLLARIRSV